MGSASHHWAELGPSSTLRASGSRALAMPAH